MQKSGFLAQNVPHYEPTSQSNSNFLSVKKGGICPWVNLFIEHLRPFQNDLTNGKPPFFLFPISSIWFHPPPLSFLIVSHEDSIRWTNHAKNSHSVQQKQEQQILRETPIILLAIVLYPTHQQHYCDGHPFILAWPSLVSFKIEKDPPSSFQTRVPRVREAIRSEPFYFKDYMTALYKSISSNHLTQFASTCAHGWARV